MPSILSRLTLFFSSYVPLWVIFSIVTREKNWHASLAFLVLSILSIVGTFIFFSVVQRLAPVSHRVVQITRKDSDTMSYIASYVVPFAATTLTDADQAFALAIFLGVLGVVYVNSGMIHVNPLLSAAGYNLYEVESADGTPSVVLTRRRIKRGDTLSIIDIGDDVFVEKVRDA